MRHATPLRIDWDADTTLAVSLDRVKTMIRVDDEHFDDVLANIHIPGAIRWAEAFMHRSILAKTHRLVLADFPRDTTGSIWLPRGKAQSVESITYYSSNSPVTLTGPTSTIPGTDWREDLNSEHGGILLPGYNANWPDIDLDHAAPVTITYSAGWTIDAIPGHVQQSIAMYCDDALANEASRTKEQLITSLRLVS